MVRLYLTNTANTRVFNVALPGARMKLVGGDSGRVEREEFVEDVVLAPSERVVVDVLFDEPGQLTLEHRTPSGPTRSPRSPSPTSRPSRPGRAVRGPAHATRSWPPSASGSAPYLAAEPDKTLAFVAEMDMGEPEGRARRLRLPDAPGRGQRASRAAAPSAA